MNYTELIKKLRIRLLLTQTEFADMLGVSFESVNICENSIFGSRFWNLLFKKHKNRLNTMDNLIIRGYLVFSTLS